MMVVMDEAQKSYFFVFTTDFSTLLMNIFAIRWLSKTYPIFGPICCLRTMISGRRLHLCRRSGSGGCRQHCAYVTSNSTRLNEFWYVFDLNLCGGFWSSTLVMVMDIDQSGMATWCYSHGWIVECVTHLLGPGSQINLSVKWCPVWPLGLFC